MQGTRKPVYTYFWTHRPNDDPAGAHHSSEIEFAFNNLDKRRQASTAEDQKVADVLSSYWANFIATGDPNGAGLPKWAAYDEKAQTVMELGDHFAPMPISTPARLDFWKRFLAKQDAW